VVGRLPVRELVRGPPLAPVIIVRGAVTHRVLQPFEESAWMSGYEHTATVQAASEAVFAYVSAAQNVPHYLPTTQHAAVEEGGRGRI
jgi:hypothetical protein